jgi:putative isomerase
MINFDLNQVPFSRYGSFLAFSVLDGHMNGKRDLFLCSVIENIPNREILRLEVTYNGKAIPFDVKGAPEVLSLVTSRGCVKICMIGSGSVRISGTGVGLRMLIDNPGVDEFLMEEADDAWQFNSLTHRMKLMLLSLGGKCKAYAPWNGTRSERIQLDFLPETQDGTFELLVEAFWSSWRRKGIYPAFGQCLLNASEDFEQWLAHIPSVPPIYDHARELAAYITWSCVVSPRGNYRRETMLVSKKNMIGIWSWDHCFNAMAFKDNEKLCWDQLMTIFDHQDPFGALPDGMDACREVFNFAKPPIHGWTLLWLMKHTGWITQAHLAEIYTPLVKWTNWWFNYRDIDGDGVPQYHHGNDSGWDNCTVFLRHIPVESPDLCAFLILQMEALAQIAMRLGKETESESWDVRSKKLFEKLIREFWNGSRFIAREALSHQPIESESLLTYLPIVLGKRLPASIIQSLLAGLMEKDRFLTDFGFATESLKSPLYQPDGYWRGPIWAPTMMMLIEGIREAGDLNMSRDLARRFCNMTAQCGMAENFDALTGKGLRDTAFTWTSSVFLLLANGYLQ